MDRVEPQPIVQAPPSDRGFGFEGGRRDDRGGDRDRGPRGPRRDEEAPANA